MALLVRVLHAHYIYVIVYIHDHISHDLVFCHSSWYLICQFILSSDLLSIYSSVLLILPLYFHIYFHIFILLFSLFMCALAGPPLMDLDFSASELEETNVPLFEGTQEDYQA